MRIVFAGTPEVALPSLEALAASDHEIVAVITRADAPLGRKRVITPSPVAQRADDLGLTVIKTDRLDDDVTARITSLQPDLGVIVAYGGLVREPLLTTPRHGWINLHFSLLPRWRGAAPVQHALIAGDRETGAAVFALVPALDAGDVYAQHPYTPAPTATAGDVLADLAVSGADVLVGVVDDIAAGTAKATPQQGDVTLAPKLTLADGALDLRQDADLVVNRFRGTTPEPGAHVTVNGVRVKVWEARVGGDSAVAGTPGALAFDAGHVFVGAGEGSVLLVRVQPAGKGVMAAADWWRGLRGDDVRVDLPSAGSDVS